MTAWLVPYADLARAAASNDPDAVAAGLDAVAAPLDEVVATLTRLHLGQLVLATLAPMGTGDRHPRAAPVRAVLAQAGVPPYDPAPLLAAYTEVRDLLAVARIPHLLLKGAVLAVELYGGVAHRPQHDVDVLVRRGDAARAARLLTAVAFRREGRDDHAVTFRRDGARLDLHRGLRAAPAYRVSEELPWRTAREATIGPLLVPTLSHEVAFLLAVASLTEDVAFGMAKLKAVCDVWLLARRLDAEVDWASWFEQRRGERLDTVAANGATLALLALERTADAPRLMEAIAGAGLPVQVRDRAHALALLAGTRGAVANMAWMGDVYPGSLTAFRLRAFLAGLPRSVRNIGPGWVGRQRRLARARRSSPGGPSR